MTADPASVAVSAGPKETHVASLRGFGWILLTFVTSRLLICWMILLSRKIVIGGEFWHPGGLLSILTQSKGEAYTYLAQNGYAHLQDQQLHNGFFPFYPFLVKFSAFGFHDVALASVIVANVALLVSAIVLNALINLDYDDPKINRAAILFLMFSPLSLFFSSASPESTFLALGLASFLAARRKLWFLACLCGICLAAVRNVGFLIMVPLLVEYYQQNWGSGTDRKNFWHPRLLLFLLIPLGACYFLWAGYFHLHRPLAYWHGKLIWGDGGLLTQTRRLRKVWMLPPFYTWLSFSALAAATTLWSAGVFFKIRISYLVYAVILIGISLFSATPEILPRNLSVVFPFFIIIGLLTARFRMAYEPLFVGSLALLTVLTVMAANGYWLP